MEAAPLIVDIERLARDGEQFVGEMPATILDLETEEELIVPAGNICYDLFIQLIGTELLVRGSVRQLFSCACVRCACDFEWESVDPSVTFSIQTDEKSFVDLTSELRECIILTLPSHPLCRTECLGLCSACGSDLNLGPCGCPPHAADRLGALDGLNG